MVLRLKTRESRSLPGLQNAQSTASLHDVRPLPDPGPILRTLGAGPSPFGAPRRARPGRRDNRANPGRARPRRSRRHPSPAVPRRKTPGPTGPRRKRPGRNPARHPDAGWSSPVARQAHNLKVVSSNLAPATNIPQNFQKNINLIAHYLVNTLADLTM